MDDIEISELLVAEIVVLTVKVSVVDWTVESVKLAVRDGELGTGEVRVGTLILNDSVKVVAFEFDSVTITVMDEVVDKGALAVSRRVFVLERVTETVGVSMGERDTDVETNTL